MEPFFGSSAPPVTSYDTNDDDYTSGGSSDNDSATGSGTLSGTDYSTSHSSDDDDEETCDDHTFDDDGSSGSSSSEDDDVSYEVPVLDTRHSSPRPRTAQQQERQRRILNLATSSSHTHSSYTGSYETGDESTLPNDDGTDGYTTNEVTDEDGTIGFTSTNPTATDDDDAHRSGFGGYAYDDIGMSSTAEGTQQTYETTTSNSTGGGDGTADVSYSEASSVQTERPRKQRPDMQVDTVGNHHHPHSGNHQNSNGSLLSGVLASPTATVTSSFATPRIVNRGRNKPPTSPSAAASAAAATAQQQQSQKKSSPPSSSSRLTHDRAPGLAKRMLLGPKGSSETESTADGGADLMMLSSGDSYTAEVLNTTLAEDLNRAKAEFSLGSPNRQTLTVSTRDRSDAQSTVSSSTTPSFLNRNEIFHRTASAAVAALLQPSNATVLSKSPSDQSSFLGSGSPRNGSTKSLDINGNLPSPTTAYEAKAAVSPNLVSKETERKLEELQSKMLDPTETLTGLLTAIASPETDVDPLAYAVRRKNACGALQTLTASVKNRSNICWTAGVLPALTSVLNDGVVPEHLDRKILFPDARIQAEYTAARNRAIAALMNLSTPVKNRIAVFHTPNLARTLLRTIAQDQGSARKGCAAILALMAKSGENRLLLAQVPGLLDTVRMVLRPRPPQAAAETKSKQPKKMYPWSDGNDSSDDSDASPKDVSSSSLTHREDRTYDEDDEDDEDDNTKATSTSKSKGDGSPRELTGYDDTADELLQGARLNIFAMLGHLVKEKDNAYHLARDLEFVTTMVNISRYQESPSHTLAIKILAHLTRHRLNKVLAFKPKSVVPALVEATQSPADDTRLFACYALQNLSQEKSCRQELAIAEHLIEALCGRCRNASIEEERLTAISTLKNLCDEPANLIPMTNTTGCVSTLMHFAHADGAVTEMMQFRACDALATLSHWLRKIATSGHSLELSHQGRAPTRGLFVPSLREVTWNQWS